MIGDSTMANRWNVPSGIGKLRVGRCWFARNSIGACCSTFASSARFNCNLRKARNGVGGPFGSCGPPSSPNCQTPSADFCPEAGSKVIGKLKNRDAAVRRTKKIVEPHSVAAITQRTIRRRPDRKTDDCFFERIR